MFYIAEVILALQYLHAKGIVHRSVFSIDNAQYAKELLSNAMFRFRIRFILDTRIRIQPHKKPAKTS